MKFLFVILLCFFILIHGKSQVNNQFAFGVAGGYRIYSGSFFIDYNLLRKLTITNEYSDDKYQGVGIGLGLSYYPKQNLKIKPVIGIFYTRSVGKSFSYDRGNDNFTVFKTKDANYLVPFMGARYDGLAKDTVKGVFLSIIINVGFKTSTSIYPNVYYVSGPPYPQKLNKIEKYQNNSVVASIGLIFNLAKRRKVL